MTSIGIQTGIYIRDLYREQQQWTNSLPCYLTEVRVCYRRLADVDIEKLESEAINIVENFHNIFNTKEELITNLIHEIEKHEKVLANQTKYCVKENHDYYQSHIIITDRIEKLKKSWNELKHSFLYFLIQTETR